MFGRRKETGPEGPYLVEKVTGNKALQELLNRRHAEGYEVVAVLQSIAYGSNAGRDVVFKYRGDA